MNPAKWSNDDVWAAIARARTDLVALLEQLDEPEWRSTHSARAGGSATW